MHEVALAHELLETITGVARQEGAHRVIRATLEVGELTCVQPEALTFAFSVLQPGTVAEGCELVVESVPLRVRCPSCAWEGPGDLERPGCRGCAGQSLEVVGGRQLRLVSIDVEDEQDA
jgi:hydrogenase nickel incorporation protein HypA/HybF